ncbi:hypothetical protein Salat_1491700 [Sesamum alatum]|uniref:Major facilitator superfamily (MFS) profile domain-containing protein n=1 Tax=Sesamum alatum TaxID=300844 RepID=A0AAE1YCU0_9LAMI|nr:hypothetical protein Salat_1491700 [Sesamum alatum]
MAGGSKWAAAVASIWIQCSLGATYSFAIYSPILKSTQSYDQSTLDSISVFKDIGANAGVLSGFLYSSVCRRRPQGPPSLLRGPWVVHAAGAIQCFVGYFFMWLAVTGAIAPPNVAVMCVFMFVASHAQTFFNTANVVTSVHNFPDYSGTMVGIMKGFLGLSAAIIIQVYQTFFAGKPATFLLMLAVAPPLLTLVLMFFVRIHHTQTQTQSNYHEKKYLNAFSFISVIVAAYLMFLIFLNNVVVLPHWARVLTLALLLLLIASPLYVAVKAHKHDLQTLHSPLNTPLIKEEDPEKPSTDDVNGGNGVQQHKEITSDDLNLVQAMRTLNFWLLFLAMLCGLGSGLATINNISQIGESLGYTARERSTMVSLWSIWNFLGRFGAGFVSDIFMHKKGWPRPLFMVITLATMAAGHVMIALGFRGNLYLALLLVGVCFGSQWSLMPTITSEIFGVQHMGTIYNTIAVANPLGSYILSVRVIGYIYDREERTEVGSSCSGAHCFRLSFFILAAVSFVGALVAVVFMIKTRTQYARIIRRKMLA